MAIWHVFSLLFGRQLALGGDREFGEGWDAADFGNTCASRRTC